MHSVDIQLNPGQPNFWTVYFMLLVPLVSDADWYEIKKELPVEREQLASNLQRTQPSRAIPCLFYLSPLCPTILFLNFISFLKMNENNKKV